MIRESAIRVQLRCRGTVQGVGFRPTVHRIATSLDLVGWVINDPLGATLEIEGPEERIDRFVDRLRKELPPLARLDAIERDEMTPLGEDHFEVRSSTLGKRVGALVPPDASVCADCKRDMETGKDRRHHYPFTTCTNCGPRFSIVRNLPYDRERTSMSCFPLCPECRREYDDPTDRRFHAEPVACPECGPRLWVADGDGKEVVNVNPMGRVQEELKAGRIVAVKGIGGFQLACRADDSAAVERLRRRKKRQGKPFAVMVRDLETAHRVVELDPDSEALLVSARAPIVLAPKRVDAGIAEEVAPGLDDLGVMIPTTPLHLELTCEPSLPPLVMTSANLSEEPLCRGNREAIDRLNGIADLFLLHDRDIARRVDDSVVRSSPRGPVVVRRARGWVPEPLALPVDCDSVIVAVGGHLQVTGCVTQGEQAFLTQHVGDLDSESARLFLQEVIDGLLDFLEVVPTVIAADAHPDYPSTWLARDLAGRHGAEVLEVQHHLAHVAAVLAENDRFPDAGERCVGIALDGTGWGPDQTAWGGEWLELGGDLQWRRLAHLESLPLIGGEAAVREPWRVAVAALVREGAEDLIDSTAIATEVANDRLDSMIKLASGSNWPRASGAGRVFEAAGALLGAGMVNRFEGEAAARLEALAAKAEDDAGVWAEVVLRDEAGVPVLPSGALLAAVARRVGAGEPASDIAAGFHATFCALAAEITTKIIGTDRRAIALGGGCLVNRLLSSGLAARLSDAGHEVLLARQVPPGDGGLSYGQAVIAAVSRARSIVPEQV